MIKIILFDDNRSICDSIGLLLSTIDDMRLVATYHNVEDVIDRVRKANPDVILMDIDMSGITGIEAVRQLRSKNIAIPVIMLTGFEDADKVFASICAGANGYILKSANMNELVGHINDVYKGGAPMTPVSYTHLDMPMPEGKILPVQHWSNVSRPWRMQSMDYVLVVDKVLVMQLLKCCGRVMKSLQLMICMEVATGCLQKFLNLLE